ncbi:hypothetical protein M569_14190 [Genlisea aurea]|uniref:Uncharacterized protein n=1 Tax=Genlisea aurea TaxID=192259 RepID=S8DLY0_9LAMI|nr:hypothetical protein M569_14190 [Genlisea aurea]
MLLQKRSWKKDPKRRRHDSVSSFSDGDSSDSERAVKSRSKGRRRTDRKRLRRRSVSSDSDDYSASSDSVSSTDKRHRRGKSKRGRVRSTAGKRKRSDRDHVRKQRRKKSSGKKSKKDSSDSSYSDSESCSTCPSRSNNDVGAGSRKRKRTSAADDIESHREAESYGDQNNLRAIDYVMDIPAQTNSRRLRSVISVPVYQSTDENQKDSYKEEILYDKDDYPSPKSVDSEEDRHESRSSTLFRDNNGSAPEMGKSGSAGDDCGKEEEDMEAILRQRAIENFRKYKAAAGAQRISQKGSESVDEPPPPAVKETNDVPVLNPKPEVENPALVSFSGKGKVEADSSSGAEPPSLPAAQEGDKAKDGSQFQEKTMAVMRGGEMVEVSYKVYIPKNARSLGRRQLKH